MVARRGSRLLPDERVVEDVERRDADAGYEDRVLAALHAAGL
jgi:hypothetical protein